MPIITITSDYGSRDPDVAALKGKLYTLVPEAVVVDITHEVKPYNLAEASYILKTAYPNFPEGTIHLLAVDDTPIPDRPFLGVLVDGHYFLSADHGAISMICPEIKPDLIVQLDLRNDPSGFPTRDLLCPVAAHLARGGRLELTGRTVQEMTELRLLQTRVLKGGQRLVGNVVYIDNFGNLVTNISKKQFLEVAKGRPFEVQFHRKVTVKKIHPSYAQASSEGMLIAIFNHAGYLEFGLSRSNMQENTGASVLMGTRYQDEINIDFTDDPNR